jgi:hypothetical protein
MSDPTHPSENQLITERREKLQALRAQGVAFPNDFKPRHHVADLHHKYGQIDNAELEPQAIAVTVGLDTGQALLLWVQPLDELGRAQGRRASAWLEAGAMPSKWHGFRCAVYSRPKTDAMPDVSTHGRL